MGADFNGSAVEPFTGFHTNRLVKTTLNPEPLNSELPFLG